MFQKIVQAFKLKSLQTLPSNQITVSILKTDDFNDLTLGEMLSGIMDRFKMISPQASFRRKLEKRNFQIALTAK